MADGPAKSRLSPKADTRDVLIIGAGISGIGAAYRIHEKNPQLSTRSSSAARASAAPGTCSAIPGIRSDSDIFTLSFPWEPWTRRENVADGDDIREYLTDDGAQARHRRAHPVQHPRVVGAIGIRPPTPGRCKRRSTAHRRPTAAGSCSSAPATTTTTSPTRRSSPASRTSRATWCTRRSGRRPGLLGQARGRHRQRRHRGQPDSGAGRDGRPRDDAAAFADVHDVVAADRPDGADDPQGVAARACSLGGAVVQRRLHRADLCLSRTAPRLGPVAHPSRSETQSARGLSVDVHFKPPLQPVGPADVPDPRQRPIRRRSATVAPRW